MLKTGLVAAAALAACVGTAAHLTGDRGAGKVRGIGGYIWPPAEIPARLMAADSSPCRSPVARDHLILSIPATSSFRIPRHREVIWHADPAGPNPFGFIPTEWQKQPQLLPNACDVEIVLASDDRRR